MPKLKTRRGVWKRFKKTKSGKIKARKSKMRHILSSKPRKQKRRLSEPLLLSSGDRKRIARLMPY